jgi:hypothetical protein
VNRLRPIRAARAAGWIDATTAITTDPTIVTPKHIGKRQIKRHVERRHRAQRADRRIPSRHPEQRREGAAEQPEEGAPSRIVDAPAAVSSPARGRGHSRRRPWTESTI